MKRINKIVSAFQGPELLREVWRARKTHPDLAREWSRLYGLSEEMVREWMHASKNWGTFSDPDVLVEAEKLSVAKLVLISKAMNNVAKDEREGLRARLVSIAGGVTWQELKARAAQLAKEMRQPSTSSSVTVSKVADGQGMKHAHVRLKPPVMEKFIARMKQLSVAPPGADESVVLGSGLEQLIDAPSSGLPDVSGSFERTLGPAFILAIPGTKYIGDGKYATTDGEIIIGKEAAQTRLSPYGWVVIYDGTNHIGECYELENDRFASLMLRQAITIDQIFCAHPGCTQLASHFEMHHTISYKDGGKTNAVEIIGTCVNHNRQNDDDPDKVKNGRHIRDDNGHAGWIPPEGGATLYNQLPATDYSGNAIARRILNAENGDEQEKQFQNGGEPKLKE
ncbi:HNH endonuclease signature motif containing protein [Corynebacterium sp. HMSC073D01]|uniref:HNH endonuclease signature motif containing protein n=1 Tax=Corynebacterium TaxID=1716 RepID=UPI0008A537FA|nr:HNH endonuclease signature motif containing protein [Corynebacterium sp. HMSC073D01]OFO46100.1 hypothetical protein HMPREF3044_11240 [Corynebacterium sp. HMSC073D01]